MMEYFRNIAIASKTLKKGLDLTLRHLKDATSQRDPLSPNEENYFEKQNAIFTVQYPKEVLPVPTVGRYKLHNEIEDCIVCDKCAKICPVDCIDIEPVRATEEFGKTSDGTAKRIYAAKFDIDMAKCCFCGLCTTVCPTECLTMTDEYDFSTFDIKEHNFEFGNMTPIEILQKKEELAAFQKKKEEAISAKSTGVVKPKVPGAKPAIQPKATSTAKPMVKPRVPGGSKKEEVSDQQPKVSFRPKMQVKKPVIKPKVTTDKSEEKSDEEPTNQSKLNKTDTVQGKGQEEKKEAPPKSARPKIPMKPKIPPKKKED